MPSNQGSKSTCHSVRLEKPPCSQGVRPVLLARPRLVRRFGDGFCSRLEEGCDTALDLLDLVGGQAPQLPDQPGHVGRRRVARRQRVG